MLTLPGDVVSQHILPLLTLSDLDTAEYVSHEWHALLKHCGSKLRATLCVELMQRSSRQLLHYIKQHTEHHIGGFIPLGVTQHLPYSPPVLRAHFFNNLSVQFQWHHTTAATSAMLVKYTRNSVMVETCCDCAIQLDKLKVLKIPAGSLVIITHDGICSIFSGHQDLLYSGVQALLLQSWGVIHEVLNELHNFKVGGFLISANYAQRCVPDERTRWGFRLKSFSSHELQIAMRCVRSLETLCRQGAALSSKLWESVGLPPPPFYCNNMCSPLLWEYYV